MAMTVASLRHGIAAELAALEGAHQKLNELDGQVGDGDLGITLLKAFRELDRLKDTLPPDLGQAFMTAGAAVGKVSSSSFGTLLATSLMTAAKATKGKDSLPWSEVPALLDAAVAAMSARGKANLGDKTVLDALDAASKAAAGTDDPAEMVRRALAGVDAALAAFRDKPNRIGRARIFADKTIGLDDPGMVALRDMVAALDG
ncbi:MAG TPA: dihydroxyacetone kinase subunit L [Bauldia sp.]|nr:dihydroxyacetone kinase subunit L [Bauldia sp.]